MFTEALNVALKQRYKIKVEIIWVYLRIIKIVGVVIIKIRFDWVEVKQDVVKLLQEKETRGHALSAGNCVAFRGTPTH